mgnify:CR=1 FL=1
MAREPLIKVLADPAPEVSRAAAMSLWTAQLRLDAPQSKVAFQAVEKLLQRAALAYQAQSDVAALGLQGHQLLLELGQGLGDGFFDLGFHGAAVEQVKRRASGGRGAGQAALADRFDDVANEINSIMIEQV